MTDERHETAQWHCHTLLEKFDENGELYDTVELEGNMLMFGGTSAFMELLLGKTFTNFGSTNARIGVGDSTTAAAATQTDLQATTNKIRKVMESGYPQHTDGVTAAAASTAFRAVFGPSEANWVWNEWGIFNDASAGRMLNRRVENLGTKAVNTTWQLTVTVSLA